MSSRTTLLISAGLAALTTVLHLIANNGMPIDGALLTLTRWATLGALIYFGVQKNSLTTWILISMLIGLEVGVDFPAFAKNLDVLSKIFIQLIKTAIAPLLFATLVIGVAGQSSGKQMGRIAVKAFTYFFVATSIALVVGLVAINMTRAGEGIQRTNTSKVVQVDPATVEMHIDTVKNVMTFKQSGKKVSLAENDVKRDWKYILLHTFPENIAKMIYEGAALQIVVFSLIFGFGLRQVTENHRQVMLTWSEALAEVMFKFVGLIMYFAPFAVGGALASTIGTNGLGVLVNMAKLLGTLYLALIAFILLVFVPVMLYFRIPIKKFAQAVYAPASLAFATSSSEAALPQAMTAMEKFGVPRKIVSFVLPTGYSFNLDGSTLYLALASMFCVQAAGLTEQFGWEKQLLVMATLMLTSKGVAAVPRASLVILAATVGQYDIPDWPIAIILGVDALMDMGRTSVNLIGNCLASAVVARWEGEFDDSGGNAENA